MPIAVYANGSLLSTSKLLLLPLMAAKTAALSQIPENIVSFEVKLIVDDDGTGTGIITELNEINNSDTISNVVLKSSPKINRSKH
jgi:hypothetical protein